MRKTAPATVIQPQMSLVPRMRNPGVDTGLQPWGRWAHGAGFGAFPKAGVTAPPRGALRSHVFVIPARQALQTPALHPLLLEGWSGPWRP